MNEPIKFYKVNEPYGVFSNFDTKHPIKLLDKVWPTTEHYFQAMKFQGTDEAYVEQIRLAPKPRDAAAMGRDRSKPLRDDWEQIKYEIMYQAIEAKFTQHKDCKNLLISTGNAEIIEHTSNDKEWADGGDGSGKNLLGKVLMEIRKKLQEQDQLDFMMGL